MNIVEEIRLETISFRDHVALIEGDRLITYGQLLHRIDALRDGLVSLDVGPGRRIAFRCRDGIDYVAGSLALLAAGAAVVPVPDSVTADEVRDTLERIDVHGLLAHVVLPGLDGEPQATIDDFRWWARPSHSAELDLRCKTLHAAFIRFSSGTTGQSKGVVLSHQSILDRTDAANRGLRITSSDVILWVLGMSHHFVVSILLFLRKGATIIVANQNFPFSVIEAAQQHPITVIYASPVHYFLLAASPGVEAGALAKVRLAISTSMKMPADVLATFRAKFHLTPAEAYGIIEIGLPFINTEPGDAGANSVGNILPDYELRIASLDADGVGEVLLRGKGMFDAYFSPWRSREEIAPGGWFDTGDLGRLDDTGRLHLLGRSKTVIICAGMKVFPEEVEQIINAVPGVAESLVSGREHPHFGQVPVAQIVLQSGGDVGAAAQAIRMQCSQKLSSYKMPVEFRVVPSLTKTASGKLVRA